MSFWYDVDFSMRQQLFDISHIIFLVQVFVIVGLFIWKLDYVKENKDKIRKVFFWISLVQVIVLYTWSFLELGFSLEAGLPIHLCRLSSILGLIFLYSGDTKIFNVVFYTSIFAIIAIFYPVNVHPIYTHVIGYSYQISHIMIILVWIMAVFVYDYKPTIKIMKRAFNWFVPILLMVASFNYLVGNGEYLYLRGDVNRPFFKEWPDVIWITVIMILSYGIMYGMTYIFDRKEK